MLFLVVVC